MSFEIVTGFENGLPDAFHDKWVKAFADLGFEIEFPPGVDMQHWRGYLLRIRVGKAPAQFIGFPLPGDAVAHVEIIVHETGVHFRTAAGQNTVDIAIQCFGAALVALLTNGVYVNCHKSDMIAAGDALKEAEREVLEFIKWSIKENQVGEYIPFTTWK